MLLCFLTAIRPSSSVPAYRALYPVVCNKKRPLCQTIIRADGSPVERAIQDRDIVLFKHLSQLRELNLAYAEINGSGFESLVCLRNLKRLFLAGTRIDDTGVQAIGKLTALEELLLTGTHISDAGMQGLKGLTQLKRLNLKGARITADGLRELQKSLPKCKIIGP